MLSESKTASDPGSSGDVQTCLPYRCESFLGVLLSLPFYFRTPPTSVAFRQVGSVTTMAKYYPDYDASLDGRRRPARRSAPRDSVERDRSRSPRRHSQRQVRSPRRPLRSLHDDSLGFKNEWPHHLDADRRNSYDATDRATMNDHEDRADDHTEPERDVTANDDDGVQMGKQERERQEQHHDVIQRLRQGVAQASVDEPYINTEEVVTQLGAAKAFEMLRQRQVPLSSLKLPAEVLDPDARACERIRLPHIGNQVVPNPWGLATKYLTTVYAMVEQHIHLRYKAKSDSERKDFRDKCASRNRDVNHMFWQLAIEQALVDPSGFLTLLGDDTRPWPRKGQYSAGTEQRSASKRQQRQSSEETEEVVPTLGAEIL